MYHHTSPENAFNIHLDGLLVNQQYNKTTGAADLIMDIYPVKPVFLAITSEKFKESGDVTFKVNISGLNLVADIPSLTGFNAYYSDYNDGLWWKLGTEPSALKGFIENGFLSYDELLTPNSDLVEVCIALTETCACIESIPPDRIIQIG